jgi:AcrR family transcriptional regulator
MTTAPSRPRPTRAEKNEATTAALLGAAAEAFAEHGFEAATMEEIAERVGLSKGALYYRYKTKEDLFLALLDERCAAYLARLQPPPGAHGPAAGGWAPLATHFLQIVREGTWPRLFFEFVSYASSSPRARRELAKRTRALRRAVAKLIESQATDTGVELPLPPEEIALALTALGNGLALERLADPLSVPDHAFIRLPALILSPTAPRWKAEQAR